MGLLRMLLLVVVRGTTLRVMIASGSQAALITLTRAAFSINLNGTHRNTSAATSKTAHEV